MLSEALYIDTAYDMMQEDGVEEVSIRKIAKRLGVSSTSLYKYFENLDELIMLASLRYLRPYIHELQQDQANDRTPLEDYYHMWELFAKHSFSHPKEFNRIFSFRSTPQIQSVFERYYTLFQEELFELHNPFKKIFLTYSLEDRNRILLQFATTGMKLDEQQLSLINRTHIWIYHGIMKELLECNRFGTPEDISHMLGGQRMILNAAASSVYS